MKVCNELQPTGGPPITGSTLTLFLTYANVSGELALVEILHTTEVLRNAIIFKFQIH